MDPTPPEAIQLRTKRLTLRLWQPEEATRLLDIRSRPEVAKWLGDPTVWTDLAEAKAMIAEWSATTLEPGPFGFWAIDSGAETGPNGTVSIRQLPGSEEIEIGWYLHPDSGGRGLASEAAGTLLEHVMSLGIDQVWAVMWPENDPSARVAASIGMLDLGVIDDPWYGTDVEPKSRVFVRRHAGV